MARGAFGTSSTWVRACPGCGASPRLRLVADPNVVSEEQKRPEQDCCNYGQHPAHCPERIEVVVDRGDEDADDDPHDREERWPPVAEPHDRLMVRDLRTRRELVPTPVPTRRSGTCSFAGVFESDKDYLAPSRGHACVRASAVRVSGGVAG
jgi:hypothetical protein